MSGGLGVCGGCGGELVDGSLRFMLETGPGPRGLSRTSVTGTRLERFDVCPACLSGEQAAATILSKMLDDEYTRALAPAGHHCKIMCLRPRHRTRIMITRRGADEFENARCPVCYGPADVTAAEGAKPVRIRLRDRIRNRVPLRETWNVKELSE
jgi:hypothetical protein